MTHKNTNAFVRFRGKKMQNIARQIVKPCKGMNLLKSFEMFYGINFPFSRDFSPTSKFFATTINPFIFTPFNSRSSKWNFRPVPAKKYILNVHCFTRLCILALSKIL